MIACDTTEANLGADNQATGLGPLGQGIGRGFLLHSGLMIHPETEEVIGLAGQKIRYRKPAPKNEPRLRRLARDRESHVWGQLIDQIGPPPEGARTALTAATKLIVQPTPVPDVLILAEYTA